MQIYIKRLLHEQCLHQFRDGLRAVTRIVACRSGSALFLNAGFIFGVFPSGHHATIHMFVLKYSRSECASRKNNTCFTVHMQQKHSHGEPRAQKPFIYSQEVMTKTVPTVHKM